MNQSSSEARNQSDKSRQRKLMAQLHALGQSELGGVTAEQLYERAYWEVPTMFKASYLRNEARREQPPEWTVGRIHYLLKQLRLEGYDALADTTANALHRKAWLLAAAAFGRGPIKTLRSQSTKHPP